MRLLVDGVFFQLATTGIARVWTSLLHRLARMDELEIAILDRGGCPDIEGVERIAFPSYTMTYTASDSLAIEDVCRRRGIDVFTSTYYTTAVDTPQVLLVHDMIPEVLGHDLSARAWKEKHLALHYAARLACVSQSTRDDLHRIFPRIDPSRSSVTHNGVDAEVFNSGAAERLPALRRSFGLDRPYLMVVGSRNSTSATRTPSWSSTRSRSTGRRSSTSCASAASRRSRRTGSKRCRSASAPGASISRTPNSRRPIRARSPSPIRPSTRASACRSWRPWPADAPSSPHGWDRSARSRATPP